jgi:hypothetical protein
MRSGILRSSVAERRPPLVPKARDWLAPWPTPKVAANRSSRGSLNAKHFSGLALEQMVEVAEGVLPREFDSIEDMPPQARRRWPTPTAKDGEPTPGGSRGGGMNLRTAVALEEGTLNPKSTAFARYPTPRAQDSYERSNWKTILRAGEGEAQDTLTRRVLRDEAEALGDKTKRPPRSHLNPDWVEWLMGFAGGWTC